MDPSVERLDTPDDCRQYAINVAEKYPQLAIQARRKGVALRAAGHAAQNDAERELLQGVYAYEEAQFVKSGKRPKANPAWRMIRKSGIIETVEHALKQPADPTSYTALKEIGLKDLTFEAVVSRHSDIFSPEAVKQSKQRLEKWEA